MYTCMNGKSQQFRSVFILCAPGRLRPPLLALSGAGTARQISRQHSKACYMLLNLLLDAQTPRAVTGIQENSLFLQAVSYHGLEPLGNRQPVSLVLYEDTQMSSYLRVHIHTHSHYMRIRGRNLSHNLIMMEIL